MSIVKGKIYKILPLETFSSGFQKKSLVIETISAYPQKIIVDFIKDKIDLLDNLQEGDEIEISYNLNGKEWTSPQGEVKYFNSITAWRIEHLDTEQSPQSNGMPTVSPQQAFATESVNVEEEDDLPF